MASSTLFWTLTAFAFVVGAVVGSFLNVVIYRVPAGKSIVSPGSHCPGCDAAIRWYDNIPILSWVVLDGRCRECNTSISARYPFVEGLTAFLSAALWIKIAGPHFQMIGQDALSGMPEPVAEVQALPWGSIGLAFLFYFVFLALLVVITFVDLDHYLIPHQFTLPGIGLGIAAAVVLNFDPSSMVHLAPFLPVPVIHALAGAIAGALAVIVLFYLYFALRGLEGLGGGDVTMMALVGAWLGWPALIFVFFAASIQGLFAAALGWLFGAGFLKDSEEILAQDDPRDAARRRPEDDNRNSDSDDEADQDSAPDSDSETKSELREESRKNGESDDETDSEAESRKDGESGDETDSEEESRKDGESGDETDSDEELDRDSDSEDEDPQSGGLAIPFGPFIALSAAEYFFLAEFLPTWVSLNYVYEMWV